MVRKIYPEKKADVSPTKVKKKGRWVDNAEYYYRTVKNVDSARKIRYDNEVLEADIP